MHCPGRNAEAQDSITTIQRQRVTPSGEHQKHHETKGHQRPAPRHRDSIARDAGQSRAAAQRTLLPHGTAGGGGSIGGGGELAAQVTATLVTAMELAVRPVAARTARTEALDRMEADKEAPAAVARRNAEG